MRKQEDLEEERRRNDMNTALIYKILKNIIIIILLLCVCVNYKCLFEGKLLSSVS